MALIGYERSQSDNDYVCGGSLISENFILSAGKLTEINLVEHIQNGYKFFYSSLRILARFW